MDPVIGYMILILCGVGIFVFVNIIVWRSFDYLGRMETAPGICFVWSFWLGEWLCCHGRAKCPTCEKRK